MVNWETRFLIITYDNGAALILKVIVFNATQSVYVYVHVSMFYDNSTALYYCCYCHLLEGKKIKKIMFCDECSVNI